MKNFKKISVLVLILFVLHSCEKNTNSNEKNIEELLIIDNYCNVLSDLSFKIGIDEIQINDKTKSYCEIKLSRCDIFVNQLDRSDYNCLEYFIDSDNNEVIKYKNSNHKLIINGKSINIEINNKRYLYNDDVIKELKNEEFTDIFELVIIYNEVTKEYIERNIRNNRTKRKQAIAIWASGTRSLAVLKVSGLAKQYASEHGCTLVGGVDVACLFGDFGCVVTQAMDC